MKALTQVWRAVRVYVFAFLANLAAQSIFTQGTPQHLTWAALGAAVVAALEVTYRQWVPAENPNGATANIVAAYKLIKSSQAAAKAAPIPAVDPVIRAAMTAPPPPTPAATPGASA